MRVTVKQPEDSSESSVATKQARAWCFTMWDRADADRIQTEPGIKAIVIGEEICPETKKVHYQGYVRFTANKRFQWWKTNYTTAHIEPRRGSEVEAAAYCRKEGKVIVDRGCAVAADSGETETEAVLNMIEAGAEKWQLYKEHRVFYFRNRPKIEGVMQDVKRWKSDGRDFKPDT